MSNSINESILLDAIPSDIMRSISDGKNPLSGNMLFMGGGNACRRFFERAAVSRFSSSENQLKSIGQIDSVKADTIEDAFNKIILKCQKIEEQNKDALEKLAVNYAIKIFSIPDDSIILQTHLVREIKGADKVSPVEPFDGDVNFEVNDVDDFTNIDYEVAKRHFLNTLNMGAGMVMSENIRGYVEDLYDIDSRLPQLYREALALNNYMIFNSNDLGITDKDRKQVGIVNISFGSGNELVVIDAQGIIFPILLCELIRGLMELFSSHGLPKDRERMEYVIKKSDYLKAEPWQMRFGPYMWEIFTDYFGDAETGEIPYIYQTMSKLKPKAFFNVMSEMMAKTKKGKEYSKKLLHKALYNKNMTDFSNKMSTRKMDKNIITDEYMCSEEF